MDQLTRKEIDDIICSMAPSTRVLTVAGIVSTQSELPAAGQPNSIYITEDTQEVFVFLDDQYEKCGVVDPSAESEESKEESTELRCAYCGTLYFDIHETHCKACGAVH